MSDFLKFSSKPAVVLLGLLFVITACHSLKNKSSTSSVVNSRQLEEGFRIPPDSVQMSVYWYWMSDHVSKEGIIADLHAMKEVGINRAFLGHIGMGDPWGKVKIFTDEWWELLHLALKTATELNIQIGLFNGPGWSQSGGPWIKHNQSMRYLTSSSVRVKGGQKLTMQLAKPEGEFEDVRVIAFPLPKDYGKSLNELNPVVTSSPVKGNLRDILDNTTSTGITFIPSKENYIDLSVEKLFKARSLTIYPARTTMLANVELLARENGEFRSVKKFVIDRRHGSLQVGFDTYAPASVSFPETSAKEFRLVFTDFSEQAGITDVELLTSPKVENYAEKTLAKMHPTPSPYWEAYQWPVQSVVNDPTVVIDPASVQDISGSMTKNGKLMWDAPAGEWMIIRTGMLSTGVTNGPSSAEGVGLEVDKMSHEHTEYHFNAFLGEIKRRIPERDRKTWKVVVLDSYETGGQNWTDGFLAKFKERYGYDALPFIPALKGEVVGSQEMSDRFLWDLRRFVADKIAYEYAGGLRKISNKNGLTTWLENYGHWGFPAEFLQYGGQTDEIAGEYWSEGELGGIECRAATSAAHIYGKFKVSAEAFTSAGMAYERYPGTTKQRGDLFYTEGINNIVLSTYMHQPYNEKAPGINSWFGNEYNRLNTWFSDMDLSVQYMKRCDYLLQQGNYVAQVAYFIGEDTPKMTGVTNPILPKGYSYDYINAEVIIERLSVENGKLVLPDGMSYDLLVLPQLETMRPELLAKIRDLVAEGGVVLGPKPSRSPSLQGFPATDDQVRKIASELWGKIDGKTTQVNRFGKGQVIHGMTMQEALDEIKVRPDFKSNEDSILFIHRKLPNVDIYFLSNQSADKRKFEAEFNVTGKVPEYWDAVTGTTRNLPTFSQTATSTKVPLRLEKGGSAFIVFRKSSSNVEQVTKPNFSEPTTSRELSGSWKVQFDTVMRGPADPILFETLVDWTMRPENDIRYYSGSAIYSQSFTAEKPTNGKRIALDLGKVVAIAKVKINGKDVGGVWTPPFELDITDFVKSGKNDLEIKVVNTWVNRLVGDSKLPEAERKTWTLTRPNRDNNSLQPSGLLGPVKILTY